MIRIGRLRWLDTLTLNRKEGGWSADGRYTEAIASQITITGNIQPYIREGEDTNTLPDGLNARDVKVLWTKDEVRTVDQYGESLADSLFLEQDQEWIALRVLSYSHTVLNLSHREVMLVRRDRGSV